MFIRNTFSSQCPFKKKKIANELTYAISAYKSYEGLLVTTKATGSVYRRNEWDEYKLSEPEQDSTVGAS
jgi:hypothetical protein